MACIFLTEKDIKETNFLLSPILISTKYQRLDKELKQKTMSTAHQNFSTEKIEGVEVITYQEKNIYSGSTSTTRSSLVS